MLHTLFWLTKMFGYGFGNLAKEYLMLFLLTLGMKVPFDLQVYLFLSVYV